MKKCLKRAASIMLVAIMMLTLVQTSLGQILVVNAAEESITPSLTDEVELQIDDQTITMQLYLNGVYEVACSLTAGSHEVSVLLNGVQAGETETLTVSEEQKMVYFRIQNGELKDSVNDTSLVHSAALTGNFYGLEFLTDPADETSTYSIASWTPADSNAELNYVGGGIYSRTFYFKTLESDVAIQDGGYKIAFDDGWDYSIGDGSNNIALTVPVGTSQLTVYVDEINGVVYDSIRTSAFEIAQNSGAISGTPFTTTVSLIGEARGAGDDNWNVSATGYEFTQISETLYRYQKVFSEGTYSYKAAFNYANWYEASGDRSISVSGESTNVIFLYDSATGLLYDSVNDTSDVAQKLGMEEIPVESSVTDLSNGSTQFIMTADTGSTVVLYYADLSEAEGEGATAFTQVELSESSEGVYTSEQIYFGDDVLAMAYFYEINGVKTLDASRDTIVIGEESYSSYTREAFTGRTANVPGTFPGQSWDATSNVMTYLGNGLYQYTFTDVPAANYEFKIAFMSWSENYGVGGISDGSNYSVTVANVQDVSVYYNDFSHLAVTSLDYIFADISLTGTGIPDGTKLSDDGLTGIYSVTVPMVAGTYQDIEMLDNDEQVTYEFDSITVEEDKDVTFYFDPSSEVYYCNASNVPIEEEKIYYNTKDTAYKSVYGAVATGEEVSFTIETGTDIDAVRMVVKGVEKKVLSLEKDGSAVADVQKWKVTTSFSTIGEESYYFVLSNGSTVKIYADDDGYYGEGTVTDLTNITPYELVVYQDGFETPDWMKNAVVYQIFPERFYDADVSNDFAQTSARGETDYEYLTDWYTLPENPDQEALVDEETYEETGAYYGDGNWSNEIYGGDLEGITERIDYLKALGVTVIYINPVFSSISSHRYDTSDYDTIDPILGDMGDFTELVEAAEENDMHIVLDGVFNHVSDDSKYFDRYYKYLEAGTDTIGAYPYWAYVYDYMAEQDVDQDAAEIAAKAYFSTNYGITDYSYTGWFSISNETYLTDDDGETVSDSIGLRAEKPVYSYEGWWGYDSMPVIMSTNGSEYQTGDWAEEIIGNDDETSVTQYWLSEGSDGWRLDVANEVSDETWQKFRESVKALDSDAVIIGEIWDDATEYLLGDMYDSVMNYVFRSAVLSYAKGGTSEDAVNTLEKIRERYPEEAFYAMMNLVGSHDTARVLSYLDGIEDDRNNATLETAFPTYETTSDLAKERQYLVVFLQFTYAGAPTIYYGDEIGMVGADDPDDRRAFTWGEGNEELVTWYATLAKIRSNYEALRTGTVEAFDATDTNGETDSSVMSYVRRDEEDTLIVLANNAQESKTISIDLDAICVDGITFTDLISGENITAENGVLTIEVPALNGVILTTDAKEIVVDQAALAPAYDETYAVAERVIATDLSLDKTTDSLQKGMTDTLNTVVTPANATEGGAISWSSSDTAVATVDSNGQVTAVGKGSAVITATALYSEEHITASCQVTVSSTDDDKDLDEDGSSDGDDASDGSGTSSGEDVTGGSDTSSGDEATDGSGTSSGDDTSSTDGTVSTVTGTITITGSEGWSEVLEKISTLSGETELVVSVSGTANSITGSVLSKLAGTKITLKVKLENGIIWKIDGSKLTAGTNYGDIDLGVTMNSSNIPAELIQKIPDAKSALQLSLDFSGEFGCELIMNVPLGTENKGMYANLYYYDPTTGKLTFMTAAMIGEDGTVDLGFTHASDYVVVISERNLENAVIDTAVETGDQAPLAMGIVAMLGVACVCAGIYRTKRKKEMI